MKLFALKRLRPTQKGQSLIEFAIGIVVLLMLVSVIVDGARALFTYLSMRDAAQEGATYAIIHPTDNPDIEERVCNTSNIMIGLCDTGDLNIDVQPTIAGKLCMGSTSGSTHGVEVTVDYPQFPLTMPLIGMFVDGNTVHITASINETIIQPPCP
jgi:Flp pilus assembly protein TadG